MVQNTFLNIQYNLHKKWNKIYSCKINVNLKLKFKCTTPILSEFFLQTLY